jgi:hypothetical protein
MLHPNKSAPADVSLREGAQPLPHCSPGSYSSPPRCCARRWRVRVSVRRLASAIGDRNTKRVEGWRAGTKALSVDSIALFPAALADRVLARLRDAVATKADGNRAVLPVPTHVMRASSALGEFAGVAAEALADGVIDDKERGVLRKCVQRIRTVVDHVSLDVDRAAGAGR